MTSGTQQIFLFFFYMKDKVADFHLIMCNNSIFCPFLNTFSNLSTIRAGIWSKRVENAFLTSAVWKTDRHHLSQFPMSHSKSFPWTWDEGRGGGENHRVGSDTTQHHACCLFRGDKTISDCSNNTSFHCIKREIFLRFKTSENVPEDHYGRWQTDAPNVNGYWACCREITGPRWTC